MPMAIGTSPNMLPGGAPAQRALDAVDQLDDLHLAGENREQRALLPALMHGVFPGTEVHVGRRLREPLEFGRGSVENRGIAATSSIVNMGALSLLSSPCPFVRLQPKNPRRSTRRERE